jgi:multidrug efflux pump subunit AcrA (membrane-fusion protein)
MTDKALRLAEELEGLACNGPDNCESGRVMRAAASLIRAQQEEIERLRGALDEIVNPLVYMQRRADADGTRLDGHMAIYVSRDPAHLQSIARAALTEEK